MASVNALLVALHERTLELTTPQYRAPDQSMLGWDQLAWNAMRILDTVDAPPELVPLLQSIATEVEGRDADDTQPITVIGQTLGVLADTLNSHPGVAALASHADRAQLRSCLLGSLHEVATGTLAAMHADETVSPVRNLIRSLAEVTEAASFVPWRPLHSPLGQLSVGPSSGGLDQVVAAWAASATDVLGSRTRSTGYAFQRTAASIAQICLVAAETVRSTDGMANRGELEAALISASRGWQIAANWPPEVRLGGHATELRHRSQDLDDALAARRLTAIGQRSREDLMQSALVLAGEVATAHESALVRVVTGGELWIVAEALGPAYLTRHPGTHRSDWVLDPGTVYGKSLLQAAHRANSTLQEATVEFAQLHRTREPNLARSGLPWETVGIDGRLTHATPTTPSIRRRSMDR